jgi:polygalacturonase
MLLLFGLHAACLSLVDERRLPPFMHAAAPPRPSRPVLRLTAFGARADGVTNNQAAFKKAFAKCDSLPDGCALVLPPTAPGVPTVYRTSAINLTSHLDLIIPANVTLRATENDVDNGGEGWPTLQHSSAPAPCAGTPGNCGCGPAKQSWIHAFNVSDVSVGGGGTIHGGGRYWWCVRYNLAQGHRQWQPSMQTYGCATTRALPNTTRGGGGGGELLQTCPPRMWHIVESHHLRLYDLQVRWAGYWTLHFQFCDQVLVEGIHLWNPSNRTFNAPNGDVSAASTLRLRLLLLRRALCSLDHS